MNYFIDALKQYGTFDGRTGRKAFWMFVLFYIIFDVIISVLEGIIGFSDFGIFSTIYWLALLIPSLAITSRRLHDVNKSALWMLWYLLPIIGWIVLLVLNIRKGDEGANKYGPSPEGGDNTGAVREAEVVSDEQQQADDELLKEDLDQEAATEEDK